MRYLGPFGHLTLEVGERIFIPIFSISFIWSCLMHQALASHSRDSERAELSLVLAALSRTPRLENLLRHIAERSFENRVNEINEYNIATEVFGRSKTSFDASRDSIARVEAYRLRRKLKEYYETEGKEHEIQIALPLGSYVPVFIHRLSSPQTLSELVPRTDSDVVENALSPVVADKVAADTVSADKDDPQVEVSSEAVMAEILPPEPLAPRNRSLLYGFAGTVIFTLVILSGFLLFRVHKAKKEGAYVPASNAKQTAPLSGVPYAQIPLRILAGYSGEPQIDSAGNVWQSDKYFLLGGTWDRRDNAVARTSDPMLFKHWRDGDFSYNIPLQPGVYELHLYFVSTEPESSGPFTSSVRMNGQLILSSFDASVDAPGPNIADERIFRDVAPASDGLLHLVFSAERGSAKLTAIEILPGILHRQLPIRLVTQPRSFIDHNGQFWHPDDDFLGGYTSTTSTQIAGTSDPDIFTMERYGNFSYAIPVDTRDRYTLILHFAEFYYGTGASGNGGDGSRLFRVLCNGTTLLDNFDIYKEAGSLHSLTKTFYHLKPSAQGKLNITFEPIANNATVSGIEVLDESQ
jgi:hypothetical protein